MNKDKNIEDLVPVLLLISYIFNVFPKPPL